MPASDTSIYSIEANVSRKLAVTYWLPKCPTSPSWSIVCRDSALCEVLALFGLPFRTVKAPIKPWTSSSLLSSAPGKDLLRVLFCRTRLLLADIFMPSMTAEWILSLTRINSNRKGQFELTSNVASFSFLRLCHHLDAW